jgi:hypothetical protein
MARCAIYDDLCNWLDEAREQLTWAKSGDVKERLLNGRCEELRALIEQHQQECPDCARKS